MTIDHGTEPDSDSEKPNVLGAAATFEAASTKRVRQRVRRQKPSSRAGNDKAEIVFIYEPHVAVVPPLRNYFSDLWERRAFLFELAKSDVRGQRSSTPLGSLWAVLDPLFMAGIYFFLFSVVRSGGGRTTDFVPLIVAGMLHFQITTTAMTEGGGSIVSGRDLMLNTTFPRALLPLSVIYKSLLKYWPSIPIILIFILIMNGADHINLNTLWYFPTMLVQLVSATGIALLTATLVVFIRDVKNLLTYVSRVMFFTTPIIYPYEILPDNLLSILKWQPFFGIFYSYQRLFSGDQPNLTYLAISAAWGVVLLVGGFWVFLRYERQFSSKI